MKLLDGIAGLFLRTKLHNGIWPTRTLGHNLNVLDLRGQGLGSGVLQVVRR